MNKEPRANKTEEQILAEMDLARKRTLIKDKFYPALEKATTSVDEAGMLLQAATSLLMEEAMETLRTKKIKEIKNRLIQKLCPDNERVLEIEQLISNFEDLTLFETRGHFESMKAVIEQMKMDDMRSRKLETLTPDWDRYLN